MNTLIDTIYERAERDLNKIREKHKAAEAAFGTKITINRYTPVLYDGFCGPTIREDPPKSDGIYVRYEDCCDIIVALGFKLGKSS